MKTTAKEQFDCCVKALAKEMPKYPVKVLPGSSSPEICCEDRFLWINAGIGRTFRTELFITVGEDYLKASRAKALKKSSKKSRKERGI